jgi:hypothetical protein
MKKLKILFVLLISMFFFMNKGVTQGYETGVGIRFGGLINGLTVKHFINSSDALEGILSMGNRSLIVTGLYEFHVPLQHSGNTNFFYGIGAHVGFFQDGGSYYYNDSRIYSSSTVAGIDGILGIDYKFNHVPLNVCMDFKPFVDFFSGSNFYFDGGISIRYTFN